MKQTGKCPKCGSPETEAEAKVIDRGQSNIPMEMCIATFRKTDALLFKEKQEFKVSAWVCTACGYLELYADAPDKLKVPKARRTPAQRCSALRHLMAPASIVWRA